MTILITDLGDTVINKFKHGTFKLAEFTVLPKYGVWRQFLERHPWLLNWLQRRKQRKEEKHRLEEGFQVGPEPAPRPLVPTIEQLAKEEPSKPELARQLPKKIREVADHMKTQPDKRYTYEEWVEITQLIRFTAKRNEDDTVVEEEEDLIEWDWIGEDSPMMSKSGEPEFVLDRLCESMHRLVKHAASHLPSETVDSADSKQSFDNRRRLTTADEFDEDVDPFDTRTGPLDSDRLENDSSPSSSSRG